MKVLDAQLYPTLHDSMDCSPPGSSVHGILQKDTVVSCHSLLQGIFPTEGLNLSLLHCKQILYRLRHQDIGVWWAPNPHNVTGVHIIRGERYTAGKAPCDYGESKRRICQLNTGTCYLPLQGKIMSHCEWWLSTTPLRSSGWRSRMRHSVLWENLEE